MKLSRPLIFLDIEATGPDPLRDKIVEIALVKLNPDGSRSEMIERVNPGIRIPSEVIQVHHITNEAIAQKPPFKDIAPQLLDFVGDADIGGFGVTRFDVPMLQEEFKRNGLSFPTENRCIVDSLVIFHSKEPRDLTAAYQYYCQKTLEGAHGAKADTLASMDVFFAQLEKYKELPQDLNGLHAFCNKQDKRFIDSQRKFVWRDGEAAVNFGKYKGELLRSLIRNQRDYIEWMVSDGKFPQDVVDICWNALRGKFPENKTENEKA